MNRPTLRPACCAGLILAGGQSRRFGSDKALHQIDGLSMIERAYNTLAKAANPILISVAHSGQTYDLPAQHVCDIHKDKGPLGGLHAGLQTAHTQWVFVTAVDLPFINESAIRLIIDHITDEEDAIVAVSNGRMQPLFGCYHTSLVASLEERLKCDQLAATQFVKDIRTIFLDMPASLLTNVNQPEDLK